MGDKTEPLFFIVDVEATRRDFHPGCVYQFAARPVNSLGAILPGATFDVELFSYDEKDHDPEILAWLHDELGITLASLQSRQNTLAPIDAWAQFTEFVENNNDGRRPKFVSDNLAYDWGMTHSALMEHVGRNTFGHNGINIPDLSQGKYGKRSAWKKFKVSPHTHDAGDDVLGIAEGFARMIKDGLQF